MFFIYCDSDISFCCLEELFEANIFGILPETSAADIENIFMYKTMVVEAHSTGS